MNQKTRASKKTGYGLVNFYVASIVLSVILAVYDLAIEMALGMKVEGHFIELVSNSPLLFASLAVSMVTAQVLFFFPVVKEQPDVSNKLLLSGAMLLVMMVMNFGIVGFIFAPVLYWKALSFFKQKQK